MTASTTRIDILFRSRVKEGGESLFQEYLEKVYQLTEAEESHVLGYEIFVQEDGTYLQHERYEDEEAIYKHLAVTAEGQAAWAEATELLEIDFIGDLSRESWERWRTPTATRYTRFRSIAR